MVEFLLNRGADMRPISICGRDVLKIAVDNDEHAMIEYVKHFYDKRVNHVWGNTKDKTKN